MNVLAGTHPAAAPRFSGSAAFYLLPLHVTTTGLLVLAALAIVSLRLYEPADHHAPMALLTGLGTLVLVLYVRYVLGFAWTSASIIYLALFWMFHFGLSFTSVVAPGALADVEDRRIAWLYWPNVRLAMTLGLIGAAGFVFGLGITTCTGARAPIRPDSRADAALFAVGSAIMLAGLAGAAVALVRGGGLGVLNVGYQEFRAVVLGPSILLTSIQVSQFGCLLALCGAGRRRWLAPFGVWLGFAGLLLLLGLRNEAMIPLVSFVVVLAHRGIHLPRGVLVAALVASLVVIPMIKTFRAVGFGNRALVNWSQESSPLATLTELGGTLRAVKAYVDWIEEGDPYLLGTTYLVPFDRQILARLLPDREQVPFSEDERVPGRLMSVREASTGTASSGEAYYNFGPIGPFIYFGFVGALFGWLERRAPETPYRTALLSTALFPFYWNIRSEWIAIPAQLGTGLVVVGFCYLLGRHLQASR